MTVPKLRILVVAPQPFMEERGTPMAVRFLVEALCDFGHEVDLLVYPFGREISYPGMRLFRSWRPPLVRTVRIGISAAKLACDALLIPKLFWLLSKKRYDVVHAVEEALFPAALWSALSGRPMVYDMDSLLSDSVVGRWRALSWASRLLKRLELTAIRKAALILPVCKDLAAMVDKYVDPESVVILPDFSVSKSPAGPLEVDLRGIFGDDQLLGLYVGNLAHYQGIELLLEAIRLLGPDSPGKFLIVGGPDDSRRRLSAMAARLGISDRVRLLGEQPVDRLGALLAQADVLLSPRLDGVNTPMKVYSYMHSGVAILATDIRSHTQVLDASMAELVPVTAEGMAAGLKRLMSDTERRKAIGAAARSVALKEYTQEAFRRRLEDAYKGLVQKTGIVV